MIYQAIKSDSQLRYKPTSNSNKTFYNTKETPFSAGAGLLIFYTEDLAAPSKMIELTMCGCSTNCLTNRCRCKKYNLVCTDICRCCKCENQMADDSVDEEDYENLFGDFSDDDDDF